MNRFTTLLCLIFLVAGTGLSPQTRAQHGAEDHNVRIAILAHRGIDTALRQWQPTMDYLSRTVHGFNFLLVPVTNDDIGSVISEGKADLVLTNPGSYVTLESSHGIYRVATLIRKQPTGAQPEFGAIIFTRSDRDDIRSLQDLRGKSFMGVHERGFGGWQMGWREIRDAGLDPYKDFSRLDFSGFPQSNVIFAVLSGGVDAGTLRTDQLERMISKGLVKPDDIKILNRQEVAGFNAALSTRLYPEWPLAITRDTDRKLAKKVVEALYTLPDNDPVLKAAGIAGWTIPYDYTPVHDLMRELKVGPYEGLGEIYFRDVLRQYWPWIVSIGLVIVSVLLVLAYRNIRLVRGSHELLYNTLHSIGDAVITTDTNGCITYLNPKALNLIDHEGTSWTGMDYTQVLRMTYESSGEAVEHLIDGILERNAPFTLNESIRLVLPGASEAFSLKLSTAPIRDGRGNASGCVLVLHDITDMQRLHKQLRYQAAHDPLTDLINRREFEKMLQQAMRRIRRSDQPLILFYMDLDNFKVVNDSCGHAAGDELLKEVTQLLSTRFRESDVLARLGGDEFGALLENCTIENARLVAEEVRKSIANFRFTWGKHTFNIGVSIGMVLVDKDSSLSEAMSQADSACYVAKDQGRNRYHLAEEGDTDILRHRGEMEWVQRIGDAFENDRFKLYCQPIVPLRPDQHEVPHHEVLIRMLSPDGELISPVEFLPAAERYDLMPTIDRWVIRTVFSSFARLKQQAVTGGININLSGQTLGDVLFHEFVFEQMDRHQIPPDAICFEVTETAAIGHLDTALSFMTDLRERGCRFALDDFGTGMSTFSYLRKLPLDYLKIDGSFVRDMDKDELMSAMVSSINHIGHVLGLKTTAEFVENEKIRGALQGMGVDYVQGYGVGKPFPFDDLLQG
ncbi:MAG: EAL domain-containing protein [Gammaproteobacteria bacterium]|nr:EAL domain-containing protein [Gammaproteobacteria bacterium]